MKDCEICAEHVRKNSDRNFSRGRPKLLDTGFFRQDPAFATDPVRKGLREFGQTLMNFSSAEIALVFTGVLAANNDGSRHIFTASVLCWLRFSVVFIAAGLFLSFLIFLRTALDKPFPPAKKFLTPWGIPSAFAVLFTAIGLILLSVSLFLILDQIGTQVRSTVYNVNTSGQLKTASTTTTAVITGSAQKIKPPSL